MEINGSSIHLVSQLPARKLSYAGAEQAQISQDRHANQPTQLLNAVEAAKKIERFEMRARNREQSYSAMEDLDSRSHKALDAYQSASGDDDLDYVSQVLGIDVYA